MATKAKSAADELVPPTTIIHPNAESSEGDGDELAIEWLGDDALQLEAPEFQTARWTVYRLNADGTIPEGSRVGRYCGKFEGPLDLEKVRERWGGGVFRMIASMPDRRRKWLQIEIEGAPVVEAVAQPAPVVPDVAESKLEGELRALREEIATLKQTAAAPPPPDPMQMFATAIQLVRETTPQPTTQLFDVFEKGLKIGRDSTGDGDSWLSAVREVVPPILETLNKPRPPAPPSTAPSAAATRAAAASGAGKPAPPSAEDRERTRKQLVTTMLADALERNLPIEELAEQADIVLEEGEMMAIRVASADQLLQAIGPELLQQYPSLRTEHARQYLDALIRELNREPDDTPPADVVGDTSSQEPENETPGGSGE